jgi:hypothetical protein
VFGLPSLFYAFIFGFLKLFASSINSFIVNSFLCLPL